jgi:alpha-1,3(6)-mannosylglycoprotein beta-1,6-N-acetyl-glucosaminyltransferase
MSRREHHCPIVKEREGNVAEFVQDEVNKRPEIERLFALMNDSDDNYEFIKARIRRLWDRWTDAHEELVQKKAEVSNRRTKNVRRCLGLRFDGYPFQIYLFLGFLGKTNFAKASKSGGPLGELVQWSDLITSIFKLGYNVQIYTKWDNLKR